MVNRLSRKQIMGFIGVRDPDAVRAIEQLFDDVNSLSAGGTGGGSGSGGELDMGDRMTGTSFYDGGNRV